MKSPLKSQSKHRSSRPKRSPSNSDDSKDRRRSRSRHRSKDRKKSKKRKTKYKEYSESEDNSFVDYRSTKKDRETNHSRNRSLVYQQEEKLVVQQQEQRPSSSLGAKTADFNTPGPPQNPHREPKPRYQETKLTKT